MKKTIYSLTAVLLALSCTDDMEISNGNNGQQDEKALIQFTVDDSQDWTVVDPTGSHSLQKAISMTCDGRTSEFKMTPLVVNGISKNQLSEKHITRGEARTSMYANFNVLAYEYENNSNWYNADVKYTETVSKDENGKWLMNEPHYWPEIGYSLAYVGIAPGSISYATITPQIGQSGKPQISLNIPADVSAQKDIMVALSTDKTYSSLNGYMDLRFKHLLTCVKFAIGENMATDCVIKSITLYNVAGQGTVTLDETNGWQIGLQNRDFEMNNIDFPVTSSTTKNSQIAPPVDNGLLATTMLMIPQHFTTDDSKIKMVYKDDAGFHSVEATLNGQNWEPGTTVTYLISTKALSETYTLITTPVTVSHDGGTTAFNVTSYKTTASGTQAMPWRIVGYSLDEGQSWYAEKPVGFNWVGVATTSGTGGTEPQQGTLVIAPQEVTGSSESSMDQTADNYSVKLQSDQLNANPARGGTTDYYDLSTHDLYGNETLRNTANCYVVNAAGYYKLPLVYGNTIKNGVKNDDIFKTDVTRYVHDATIISTPYLKDVDTPDAATLLWQDSNGLVSDDANDTFISEENGEYYLNFHVPSGNTLKPGNAIIGVKKGSDFMWSWHIWVTPIDITSTIEVTNAKGYKYKFMPVNLGWCALNGTFENYSGRSMLIKIQQGSGISSIFRVTQIGGAELVNSTRGYAPYYQFGRKDPMLPNDGTTYTKDHNQYPTGGSYLWKIQDNATTLTNTIRNPYIMFHPTVNTKSDWCTSTPPWARLWNTTGEEGAWDIKVTKTIYDPCPVGFHVPPSNAFTGFSKTGENTTNKNQIYASNPTTYLTDRGCWFYTNTTLQHQTIFFPASSYRYYLSGKMYEDVHSYYRTAMRSSADETRSICLGLNDDGVNVCFAYTSAAAFYVRPIAE